MSFKIVNRLERNDNGGTSHLWTIWCDTTFSTGDISFCLVIVVRFLVLVTTMVTKVDHSNYCSKDRSNHRGYYDGYYDDNT